MSSVANFSVPSESASGLFKQPPRIRIDFLDGIRGLAALYVMLAHIFSLATFDDGKINPSLSPIFVYATHSLAYAHFAVAVFIVLSGFCLMLPVARSQDKALPGGLLGFAKRRARRILPPYYVALASVLGILFASHHFIKHTADGLADLSAMNIVSHLLLVHNLFDKYNMALDGPMWSVAWEWQIYFLFALILLPVWRYAGIVWAIVAGFVLGFMPIMLLPQQSNLSWTSPWYVGLFALGMGGAVVLCSQDHQYPFMKNALLQRSFVSVTSVVLLMLTFVRPHWVWDYEWIFDPIVGAVTIVSILLCTNRVQAGKLERVIVKGLESRPAMTLGAFSYSLYLIHYPVIQKMQDILHRHHVSHYAQFALLLLVGIPVCLALAYLFHVAFERPFMPGHPKTERQAEAAAIISPAP